MYFLTGVEYFLICGKVFHDHFLMLFWQPYIVRPTLCWKLDWEDLESNQQHFYALCSVLKERVTRKLLGTIHVSIMQYEITEL